MTSTTVHSRDLNDRFARLSPGSASRVLSRHIRRNRETLRVSLRAAAAYEAAHTPAARRAALAQFQTELGR